MAKRKEQKDRPAEELKNAEGDGVAKEGVEREFELTSSKKDTPEVDIVNVDGIVSAVVRQDGITDKLAGEEKGVEAKDPEVVRLEEEVAALNKEIERLNKEILESPAEKLRAELEVSKREYEVLLGNQPASKGSRTANFRITW